MKRTVLISLTLAGLMLLGIVLVGCGDSDYDQQIITVVFPDESEQVVTIGQLRKLPQRQLDASFKRSTGTEEEYDMEGPFLADVLREVGADITAFAGVSVGGSDNYYTMLPQDIIAETPDLILALKIDGKTELNKGIAPAQLAVQGQLGPYWVKMVDTIVLYDEVPEKNIKTVWIFETFIKDVETEAFPYFGSDDKAVNLEKIWPMLDNVDSKAFFTMKSSDGYFRNESLNSVMKQYFIKYEGDDAPINVSPNIDPTFGVKNIARFSTNEDVFVVPWQLALYCATETVGGQKALPLDEICYEVGIEDLKSKSFELIDYRGQRVALQADELASTYLFFEEGSFRVQNEAGESIIDELLSIRTQ